MKSDAHLVPTNPAGSPVLSCDLDVNCAEIDCESLLPDFPYALTGDPVAPEYLAHYCGLDFLDRLRNPPGPRK